MSESLWYVEKTREEPKYSITWQYYADALSDYILENSSASTLAIDSRFGQGKRILMELVKARINKKNKEYTWSKWWERLKDFLFCRKKVNKMYLYTFLYFDAFLFLGKGSLLAKFMYKINKVSKKQMKLTTRIRVALESWGKFSNVSYIIFIAFVIGFMNIYQLTIDEFISRIEIVFIVFAVTPIGAGLVGAGNIIKTQYKEKSTLTSSNYDSSLGLTEDIKRDLRIIKNRLDPVKKLKLFKSKIPFHTYFVIIVLSLVTAISLTIADAIAPSTNTRQIGYLFYQLGASLAIALAFFIGLHYFSWSVSTFFPHTKLIIVIQDLDRCTRDKAIKVIQAVTFFSPNSPFIIIFLIDQQMIVQAVDDGIIKTISNGYEFVASFITTRFYIPPLYTPEKRSKLCQKLGWPKIKPTEKKKMRKKKENRRADKMK